MMTFPATPAFLSPKPVGASPAVNGIAFSTDDGDHGTSRPTGPYGAGSDNGAVAQHIVDMLQLLRDTLPMSRKVVHEGDRVHRVGERFASLYVLSTGFFKVTNLSADGREHVVALKFRGDWLGFDGIAPGHYGCDAVAMDTSEVWSIHYDVLLQACAEHPPLLTLFHAAMSREIARDRDLLLSLCTLPAEARVANFLRYWANSMAQRGLRTDLITLRMTRAEIGNYLGMTLETASRALTRLARENVIQFREKGRRDIFIPEVKALADFIRYSLAPPVAE